MPFLMNTHLLMLKTASCANQQELAPFTRHCTYAWGFKIYGERRTYSRWAFLGEQRDDLLPTFSSHQEI